VHTFVSDASTLANFPGQALDVEFNDVKTTTDQIRANLALIQRDDGAPANGIVTYDTLSASLQTNGLAGAASWVTANAYLVGTTVYQNFNLYRCLVAHTSGVFATDLAAGKWLLLVALPAGPQGIQGIQGIQGNNGATGNTGATGASYGGTSATSLLIANSVTKTFTTQAGLAYQVGNYVRASSAANGANFMEGNVSSYSGTTLAIAVTKIGGSGTFADWAFATAGAPGTGDLLSTNNLSDVAVPATARANLGLAIGTNVQAADPQLTSNIRQNPQSANYTTVLADAEKMIQHPAADNNARTFTIDSNANVPYIVGTVISFDNEINTLSIAIASDTLVFAPSGATGTRTLAANGFASAVKTGATKWKISGVGLS
jgi:hypothetical protein